MKEFVVFEHIYGIPFYLDEANYEITDYAIENCKTEKEVEKYVEALNKIRQKDKHERKANLYVCWCC